MNHKPRLSVNINKVALIRNARGGNLPDLVQFALDCESFGAQGITVHPRPDERHIKFSDLQPLKDVVKTEFNVEGYPNENFLQWMERVVPHQCTLVPDKPSALTSDAGWDIIKQKSFLKDVIERLHQKGIRVSLFVDPDESSCRLAKEINADRIEFYTGPFAKHFASDRAKAIIKYSAANEVCRQINLGVNAGHDLNLDNLSFFISEMPDLSEVSIGHALISDALYFGINNTIQMYLNKIHNGWTNHTNS